MAMVIIPSYQDESCEAHFPTRLRNHLASLNIIDSMSACWLIFVRKSPHMKNMDAQIQFIHNPLPHPLALIPAIWVLHRIGYALVPNMRGQGQCSPGRTCGICTSAGEIGAMVFAIRVAAVGARLDSDEIQKSLKPGAFPVAEWHETQMRNDMA
jgi:hypothetical protein